MRPTVVPISSELFEQLSEEGWSEPLQVRVIEDELVFRTPVPPWVQTVQGRCPVCGCGLHLNDANHVRCISQDCKDRGAAGRLLRDV